MNHLEYVQGTDEWTAARLGKVTASRMDDLLARTKSGYGASRANYMATLIAERMTGVPADSYTSAAMAWGIEHEPQARSAYEFLTDTEVQQAGFVIHPTIPEAGASPDGFIGDDGLIEIKCPNTATHIDTLLTKTVPGKYIKQMQWQMACTMRKWCDFVSYDPRMPGNLAVFVRRVERDDEEIDRMEDEVWKFLFELMGKIEQLNQVEP